MPLPLAHNRCKGQPTNRGGGLARAVKALGHVERGHTQPPAAQGGRRRPRCSSPVSNSPRVALIGK
eukprot:scaffold188_cov107-Isochrysis_galbana.AAC.6